jgi:pimeloyl-ACP methyl ester carboxylesterase
MTDTPTATAPYQPRRAAHSRHLGLRHDAQGGAEPLLRTHLVGWCEGAPVRPDRPLCVLLHGWMDVAASFQFTVDALAHDRPLVAPDWRGFGLSQAAPTDGYHFADYLADLDALLDALSPDTPVDLVGHSMGGNVAMLYSGIRPERVRRLVNLEGFGMPATRPEQAPGRYARWLDELRQPASLRGYDSLGAVARRLRLNNPRLSADKALWLAGHWSSLDGASGEWRLRADPAHKRANPVLARQDEMLACWRRITAPVLWLEGAQTRVLTQWGEGYPRSEFEARIAQVPRVQRKVFEDCGHMLHHDQPRAVAQAIEAFLDGPAP